MEPFEISIISKDDGRYLEGFKNMYAKIIPKTPLKIPLLKRCGGDIYSENPYLQLVKFKIIGNDSTNECFIIKEHIDKYDLNLKDFKRNLDTIYYVPWNELNKTIKFNRTK